MKRLRRRIGRIAPWWRRFKRNGYRPDRCDLCGGPFRGRAKARHSYTGSEKHWHRFCQGYIHQKRKAEDRLEVLGVVMELAYPLTGRDVQTTIELRTEDQGEKTRASNRAWSVFYDLAKTAPDATGSQS